MESITKIEFEFHKISSITIIYTINFILIFIFFWNFILKMLYSTNIPMTVLELCFLINFLSLVLLEISFFLNFNSLINGLTQIKGLSHLINLYQEHGKIYTRYFVHGVFIIIKIFEFITPIKYYLLLTSIIKSFFNSSFKLLKCFVAIYILKLFFWVVYETFNHGTVILSIDSLIILFCKFEGLEDFLGNSI